MLKYFQSFLFVILVQLSANIIFALFTIFLNFDMTQIFNDYNFAFIIQNIIIILIYFLITIGWGLYFRNSYKFSFKARILGSILLIAYLISFYLSINDLNLFKYFLYIHYPIGSLFRTVVFTSFTLIVRISLLISIISACFGVYLGHRVIVIRVKLKKKSLSSSK